MLSCKEVSIRVSESLDRKLPLRERLKVKLHLLMCQACQRMVRQMALLREASGRYASAEAVAEPGQERLSFEARQRILQGLRSAGRPHRDHE
jgi:predicted anti-sigma-YlaC factor YlaD